MDGTAGDVEVAHARDRRKGLRMGSAQGLAEGLYLVEAGGQEHGFGVVAELVRLGLKRVEHAEGYGYDILDGAAYLHAHDIERREHQAGACDCRSSRVRMAFRPFALAAASPVMSPRDTSSAWLGPDTYTRLPR